MTRRKIEPVFLVQADQFAVEADGRGAGGQARDRRPAGRVVLANQALDHQGDVPDAWALVSKTSVGILVCGM